jgi:hypothetical protein
MAFARAYRFNLDLDAISGNQLDAVAATGRPQSQNNGGNHDPDIGPMAR